MRYHLLQNPSPARGLILALALLLPLAASSQNPASPAQRISLDRFATSPLPVALVGYSGEVAETLRFDLEVAGCRVAPEVEAQIILTGSNASRVEGKLTDRNQAALFAKAYSGGTLRQQAHALADDVIRTLGGQGIAQTLIAFKGEPARGESEIYVADYDGHNPRQLTRDRSIVAAPTWVSNRRMLVYTSYRLGNPDVFSHDLTSGERRPVSRHAGLNSSAAVSPNGQRVALILSKDGSPNLYTMNLNGSAVTRLTNNRQGDSSPCWSPDGNSLCYSSRSGGPSALYLIPAAGGQPRKLPVRGVSNATEPDWSPDGRTIVFTTQRGGGFEICTVPANGGEANRLVSGEDPVWAPNSRTVIYARRAGGGVRLLSLLDVPTRQTKDLPRFSGSCSQPSWAR